MECDSTVQFNILKAILDPIDSCEISHPYNQQMKAGSHVPPFWSLRIFFVTLVVLSTSTTSILSRFVVQIPFIPLPPYRADHSRTDHCFNVPHAHLSPSPFVSAESRPWSLPTRSDQLHHTAEGCKVKNAADSAQERFFTY